MVLFRFSDNIAIEQNNLGYENNMLIIFISKFLFFRNKSSLNNLI